MKKTLAILLAMVMMFALIAACGNGEDEPPTRETREEPRTQENDNDTPERVEAQPTTDNDTNNAINLEGTWETSLPEFRITNGTVFHPARHHLPHDDEGRSYLVPVPDGFEVNGHRMQYFCRDNEGVFEGKHIEITFVGDTFKIAMYYDLTIWQWIDRDRLEGGPHSLTYDCNVCVYSLSEQDRLGIHNAPYYIGGCNCEHTPEEHFENFVNAVDEMYYNFVEALATQHSVHLEIIEANRDGSRMLTNSKTFRYVIEGTFYTEEGYGGLGAFVITSPLGLISPPHSVTFSDRVDENGNTIIQIDGNHFMRVS